MRSTGNAARTGANRVRRGRIVSVALDPSAHEPLYRQIYESLRADIRTGRLAAGSRLPSTRHLAADLAVARSTVVQAYEQLRGEGYIEGVLGAGTRVAETIPDRCVTPAEVGTPREVRPRRISGVASRRAQETLAVLGSAAEMLGRPPRAFRAGVPAVDVFPVDIWGRLLARRWARTSSRMLAYSDPFGFLPLREATAEYLRGARGVRCTAEQLLITSGSQQALDLCARVLLDPGDRVWLEDPGYHGARGAFTAAGAEIVPVPVDGEGMRVDVGRAQAPDARAAFITPSRQLPLGVTLSAERRASLLDWAHEQEAWIVEDDYDSEFRFASRPLPSLQGSDPHGTVIYTGTFSKVMFPSMRLGYLVVPEPLLDVFRAMRHFSDYQSVYLEQAVMADFITEGHFERHIRRMRAMYAERQATLVEAARSALAGRLDVAPADSGMTLVGWLKGASEHEAVEAARAQGVDVLPLSRFSIREQLPPALLLGYAGVTEVELREGVLGLRRAFDDIDRARRRRAG